MVLLLKGQFVLYPEDFPFLEHLEIAKQNLKSIMETQM